MTAVGDRLYRVSQYPGFRGKWEIECATVERVTKSRAYITGGGCAFRYARQIDISVANACPRTASAAIIDKLCLYQEAVEKAQAEFQKVQDWAAVERPKWLAVEGESK